MTRAVNIKTIEKRYRESVSELADFGDASTKVLVEAFGQVVTDLLKIEDDGWLEIQGAMASPNAKGIDLENAKARFVAKLASVG